MTQRHLETLIEDLSRPEAFPDVDADSVEVRQTHISVVFLVADRVFKLKKPVDLGFVDYSTLERRRRFCEAEVELNRRLAPEVYLGIRPIVEGEDGELRVGTDADAAVEWAVEMVRLDDGDQLKSHLHARTLRASWMDELGEKIAVFHRDAERGEHVSAMARLEVVSRNALDNFRQSRDQVGRTVSPGVLNRLEELTRGELERLRPLIEERARRGMPCDTHGDLRLEHVYRVDDEVMVIDCIEFNDAFRYSDPVEDLAFMAMDLRFRWRDDLADRFVDSYFRHSDDPDGRALVDFYVAYRSAVRAKVHGMAAVERELSDAERERAIEHSRGHWNFALSTLADPRDRPALLMLAGLPGVGKSTLSKHLEREHDFLAIDTDVVRKTLAGLDPEEDAADVAGGGIYTSEWTRKTYEECLSRALQQVSNGERAAVEGTFRSEAWRERFLLAARGAGVDAWIIECILPREVALERIDARRETISVSDAGRDIYEHVEKEWEPAGEFVSSRWHTVSTLSADVAHSEIEAVLRQVGLC